ncbi:MAG: hypothetical protein WC725_05215 [Patescibacteria group bacterium]
MSYLSFFTSTSFIAFVVLIFFQLFILNFSNLAFLTSIITSLAFAILYVAIKFFTEKQREKENENFWTTESDREKLCKDFISRYNFSETEADLYFNLCLKSENFLKESLKPQRTNKDKLEFRLMQNKVNTIKTMMEMFKLEIRIKN